MFQENGNGRRRTVRYEGQILSIIDLAIFKVASKVEE
jgi:hypothetical protein